MQRRIIPYILLACAVFLLVPAVSAEEASEWYVKAQNMEINGDYATALEYYTNAIAAESGYLPAYAGKAGLLNKMGRYEEALAAAEVVLASKKDPVAAEARAFAFFSLGRYEESVAAYDLFFTLRQNVPEAYCNQARAYVKLDLPDKALTSFDRCVKLDPANLAGWNEKGLLFYSEGRYNESIDAFNHCTRISRSDPVIWNNKGLAYAAIEDYENAMSCFKTALNLDPSYAEAQKNLDLAYQRKPFITTVATTAPVKTVVTTALTATLSPPVTTNAETATPGTTKIPATAAQPATTAAAETKTTYAPLPMTVTILGILAGMGISAIYTRRNP